MGFLTRANVEAYIVQADFTSNSLAIKLMQSSNVFDDLWVFMEITAYECI